nr:DUF4113 domain-containing protein [Halomonas xianhensis]
MHAWDAFRQRYGRDSLTLGLRYDNAIWPMNSRYRSPCYTTRWDELPQVST